jgi:APA family basic amino acid/polyamine antiporter
MAGTLKRVLSLPQLIFYGVGTIVGAGIYSVIGVAAGMIGTALWLPFVLASFIAALTALSYAELVAAFPKAGAEYQFLRHAFPRRRLPAFVAGYLIALSAAATSATVALAFGGYLQALVPLPPVPVALALLAACTLLNIAGIRQSTWVGIALICIEVGGLVLLVAMGFMRGEAGPGASLPRPDGAGVVVATTALVFFVYIGFEDIANLAEESKDPQRHLPRALLVSVAITSALYLLVVLAVLQAVDAGTLAASESPLEAAGATIAPWLGTTMSVTALFATASTALIALVSISRLLFGMGRDGDMPAWLARTLGRRQTPWLAAITLGAAACALVPLGEVKTVASVSSLGVLTVFASIHVALIVLRYRQPQLERPFRVPLAIGRLPVIPALAAALCLGLMTQFEGRVYLVFAPALLPAVALYWWAGRDKRRDRGDRSAQGG